MDELLVTSFKIDLYCSNAINLLQERNHQRRPDQMPMHLTNLVNTFC